jgi:hypothetical protein
MIKQKIKKGFKYLLSVLGIVLGILFVWQFFRKVPTTGEWPLELQRLSTAEFNGNLVTVKNVRNFRYNGSEKDADITPNYYDKTYDLTKISKVWYITEPFNETKVAAHTFLSFEFTNGDFLSISIEARERAGQLYSVTLGMLHTYPLIYIAADERDIVFLRANIRKSNVYVYPVKANPEQSRKLFVDMLEKMNDLTVHPAWYNTLWANCTSLIAYHIGKIWPGRLPYTWKVWLTGYADQFALDQGLIDTNLTLDQARAKYLISPKSRQIGDVDDYSKRVREFDSK